MKNTPTKIFIAASVSFGVIALSMIFTTGIIEEPNPLLLKSLLTSVAILLPSFALSVATKYL